MITTSAASMAVCGSGRRPWRNRCWSCASAGASLMPSPAMAVRPRRVCRSCSAPSFSSGMRLACSSAMPAWVAMAWAVAKLSPVSITGRTPSALRAATAAADDGLSVSATAQIASTSAPAASKVTVRPASSCTFRRASSAGGKGAWAWIQRELPSTHSVASMRPCTPQPAAAAKASTSARGLSSPAAMALETGWSERAARLRAQRVSRATSASADNGLEGHQPWPALGERAGLVQRHGLDAAGPLQEHPALDENAAPCRRRQATDHGHRRGDHQRARTRDHQEHQRLVDCLHPGPARQRRGQHHQGHREHEHGRRVDRREAVHEALRGRTRALGVFHRMDDAGQRAVCCRRGGRGIPARRPG